MYRICIFAGTTEGRKLVKFLSEQKVLLTACVATEYGETLIPPAVNLTVSAKRLTRDEMVDLFEKNKSDLVIDATHPYAAEVTENIAYASDSTNTEYVRVLRDNSKMSADTVFVSDIAEAVEYLNTKDGNIFLTTGSKELSKYMCIRDFSERVYARVLPVQSSLDACADAGLKPSHIIAMQGPFSEQINIAMLESVSAKYLVTKDGGDAGGFDEKLKAAQKTGVQMIVIGRPIQKKGLSFSETVDMLCSRFGFTYKPKVTIVGIGPGNQQTMTDEALKAISDADCLIGAKRMLDTALCSGKDVFDAIKPDVIADYIMSHPEYTEFAVLMSGDTGFFSGTKKLMPLLGNCEVKVLSGINSLVYLCSKLKMSYEDIKTVSLHGRDINIVSEIRANERVFVLVGGENGVKNLCKTLVDADLGDVKVYVGERLSYPDEKITQGTAEELVDGIYSTLSVVLIENECPDAVVTHGLSDNVFERILETDSVVPMTKSEVHTVCLSKLKLTERAIYWDVGAGTGSVAVEMALQACRGQVYAIERKSSAIELLNKNKNKFMLENLTVISGTAPDICSELPTPTHVFIGGSSGNMKEIIAVLIAKNPDVRIVATAISLETVAELTDCIREFEFQDSEIVCMNVSKNKQVGSYNLMNGQNPVYIFTMQNGGRK